MVITVVVMGRVRRGKSSDEGGGDGEGQGRGEW